MTDAVVGDAEAEAAVSSTQGEGDVLSESLSICLTRASTSSSSLAAGLGALFEGTVGAVVEEGVGVVDDIDVEVVSAD